MNVRMTVLIAVLAAFYLVALAVSQVVMPHNASQEQTSAQVSKAEVKEGSDLKTITELNPYMRSER